MFGHFLLCYLQACDHSLFMPGIVAGMVLSFAHTLGEFGVVLMVGGNRPALLSVSISFYDEVQALNYDLAGQTSCYCLVFVSGSGRHLYSAAESFNSMADDLILKMEKRFPSGATVEADLYLPQNPPSVTVLFGLPVPARRRSCDVWQGWNGRTEESSATARMFGTIRAAGSPLAATAAYRISLPRVRALSSSDGKAKPEYGLSSWSREQRHSGWLT